MSDPTQGDGADRPRGSAPSDGSNVDDRSTVPYLAWRSASPVTRLAALLRGVHNQWRALVRLVRRRRPPTKAGPLTVLLTGASTGVGLEVARQLLATTPHRLVLTARAQSLPRFAVEGIVEGPRVLLHALDVTRAEDREAVVNAARERWGGVDVLVNNAAVSYRAVVEHVRDDEAHAQLDANFFGPMALTRLVLPHMREQRFGRIVNVSSVGGMTAMPTMAIYSASKFALEGASEALWYEVRPWGISVTLVRPGFINSDAFLKVYFTDQGVAALADPSDPYFQHYFSMNALIEALMTLTFFRPEDVAETIVATIGHARPPLRVAGTWDAALFDLLRRFLPSWLHQRLLVAGLPYVWRWGEQAPIVDREAMLPIAPAAPPEGSPERPTIHILRSPLSRVGPAPSPPRAPAAVGSPPSVRAPAPSEPHDTVVDLPPPSRRA